MVNFGQSKQMKNQAGGGGLNRLRLEKGENIHRILFGPVKLHMLYYPTLIEDQESVESKQRMKIIKVADSKHTHFSALASLEKRIRSKRGEENNGYD